MSLCETSAAVLQLIPLIALASARQLFLSNGRQECMSSSRVVHTDGSEELPPRDISRLMRVDQHGAGIACLATAHTYVLHL
jgi:hypothetical protein